MNGSEKQLIEKFEQIKSLENSAKIQLFLGKILEINNEYKPEIPEKIISGISLDNKFRVRKNYFQGLIGYLQLLFDYIPDKNEELKKDIKKFISFFTSKEFHDRLTTKEDLNKVNAICEKIFFTLKEYLPEEKKNNESS